MESSIKAKNPINFAKQKSLLTNPRKSLDQSSIGSFFGVGNKKAAVQARKIVQELQNFVFKKEQSLKVVQLNKESEVQFLQLSKEEEKYRLENLKSNDPQINYIGKELSILSELKLKLMGCMAELEERKECLDTLKIFASKFVTEIYEKGPRSADTKILDFAKFLGKDLGGKKNEQDYEFDNKLDGLRQSLVSFKKNKQKKENGEDLYRSLSSPKELAKRAISNDNLNLKSILRTKSPKFEKPVITPHKKVLRLKDLTKIKKKANTKDHKKLFNLVCQIDANHKSDNSDSEGSIDSNIHNSVLDELDDEGHLEETIIGENKKNAGPKTRNFTTIKISFKIDTIHTNPVDVNSLLVKKDRIYKTFHLSEMEFHLKDFSLCGIRLTFYDHLDDAFYLGKFHGQTGSLVQKFHFEKGEFIEKLHFASDIHAIHHIEIVTSHHRNFVIGKQKKDVQAMGLPVVNRYFSDKDMLYNFFACFNKKTRKINYIRFLFVRKNKIQK